MFDKDKSLSAVDTMKFSWIQAFKQLKFGQRGVLGPVLLYFLFSVIYELAVYLISPDSPTSTHGEVVHGATSAFAGILLTLLLVLSFIVNTYLLTVIIKKSYGIVTQNLELIQASWRQAKSVLFRVLGFLVSIYAIIFLLVLVMFFVAVLVHNTVSFVLLVAVSLGCFVLLPWLILAFAGIVIDGITVAEAYRYFKPAFRAWGHFMGSALLTFLLPIFVLMGLVILFAFIPLVGMVMAAIVGFIFFLINIPLMANFCIANYCYFKNEVLS